MRFLAWLFPGAYRIGASESDLLLASALGWLEGLQEAPELRAEIRAYFAERGLL